jgi:hypothetical protein
MLVKTLLKHMEGFTLLNRLWFEVWKSISDTSEEIWISKDLTVIE